MRAPIRLALGRVAAQRQEVAHAVGQVRLDHRGQLRARLIHTREVRKRRDGVRERKRVNHGARRAACARTRRT